MQSRDNEIRRLAFDGGVPVANIAKQYGVTESRVSQILDVTSNRQRIWQYLAQHPDETFTIREIAQALDMDINRAMFYVDSLRKKGALTATEKRNDGKGSGDHHTWVNIRLKRRPANGKPHRPATIAATVEPVQLANGETAVITSEITVPVEGEPVIEDVVVRKAQPAPEGPWIKGNIDGWPELRAIRDRARVAKKRSRAAELLAETGDDDLALQIMEKTSFTALENEVIHLLQLFGEL
jgi:hypothetical protein